MCPNPKTRRRYRLSSNTQHTNKKFLHQALLSGPYTVWMIAFILIPLFIVIYYGVTSKDGGFSLENVKMITEPTYRDALFLSLKLSLYSTIICLLLAYPLAMILKSFHLKNQSLIVMIFILPMWINFLLRTIAWMTILENNGILNMILSAIGLPTLHIINTPAAVVVGMVYDFLPFMILPIYNSLAKIDDSLINASKDLGANSFQTFRKITLPLSVPGIISGITMVFIPSLTTFAISEILGGGKLNLIGNFIERQFLYYYDWNAGSGLSLVLMLFILISMAFVAKFDKSSEGTNLW